MADLAEQVLPGGYRASWTRDATGAEIGLDYTHTDGTTATDVLSWSRTLDVDDNVLAQAGPASEQVYAYDDRDRLARVHDITPDAGCETRTYGFSPDSNRTSLTTHAPDAVGDCDTSTGGATVSDAFDTADRIISSGYVYDDLGRTTTVPVAHTDQANTAGAGRENVCGGGVTGVTVERWSRELIAGS